MVAILREEEERAKRKTQRGKSPVEAYLCRLSGTKASPGADWDDALEQIFVCKGSTSLKMFGHRGLVLSFAFSFFLLGRLETSVQRRTNEG